MLSHVFKLIWQRKGRNFLLILEMFLAFLVLFALVSAGLRFYRLYAQPLGFEVADTWAVLISMERSWTEKDSETIAQLLPALRQLSEVEEAHVLLHEPFRSGGWGTGFYLDGRLVEAQANRASDGLTDALGMRLLAGRWFGPEDAGQSSTPIVINREFAERYFADENPLGRTIEPDRRWRIVGIFEAFRQYGEFSPSQPYIIERDDGSQREAPSLVLILRPGVTAGFQEKLMNVLQAVAPAWNFDVRDWAEMREAHHRSYLLPLLFAAVLVAFLMLMVGLGLLGMLWQNTIRRSPELGLRRAMGATASAVRLQVVLELLALACLALFLGLLVVVQFPLTGLIEALNWSLFIPSAIISAGILLGLCVLFALYPSFQATRREPVEALRYE